MEAIHVLAMIIGAGGTGLAAARVVGLWSIATRVC
jgi:hypothetical protein